MYSFGLWRRDQRIQVVWRGEEKVLYSRDVKFNEGDKKCTHDSQIINTDDYKLIVDFSNEAEHESVQDVADEQPILLRCSRQRSQPNYYGREQSNLTESPTKFHDANASQDKAKWRVPMETEMKSLKENEVWELPPGRRHSAVNGYTRRKLEWTVQSKDTKQGLLLKDLPRNTAQIMMKPSAP